MSLQARYTILRKIADGGTAEIFLATQHGAHGFEKTVVLKRIFPAFYADPQFRNMLVDEAHIAMSLNHSNIVQVLDLGEADGQYVLAMDLVDGWTLDAVLRRSRTLNTGLPPALALYLTAEVCRALAYAHAKTDADEKPLGIVHRDISPHNLLLSEQGEVKLTDFGIAKARNRRESSLGNMIKGKIAYMSPEQASGGPLDSRSDLFSVGTMLYVMVCWRYPFDAPTDLEMLLLVKNGECVPPEVARPGLNPEIYRVLHRAMAKAPADRYQRAEDMLVDVEQVMRVAFRAVGQTELKRWLQDLSMRDGVPPLSRTPAIPWTPPAGHDAHETLELKGVGTTLPPPGTGATTQPPPAPAPRPKRFTPPPARTGLAGKLRPPPPAAAMTVGKPAARPGDRPQEASVGHRDAAVPPAVPASASAPITAPHRASSPSVPPAYDSSAATPLPLAPGSGPVTQRNEHSSARPLVDSDEGAAGADPAREDSGRPVERRGVARGAAETPPPTIEAGPPATPRRSSTWVAEAVAASAQRTGIAPPPPVGQFVVPPPVTLPVPPPGAPAPAPVLESPPEERKPRRLAAGIGVGVTALLVIGISIKMCGGESSERGETALRQAKQSAPKTAERKSDEAPARTAPATLPPAAPLGRGPAVDSSVAPQVATSPAAAAPLKATGQIAAEEKARAEAEPAAVALPPPTPTPPAPPRSPPPAGASGAVPAPAPDPAPLAARTTSPVSAPDADAEGEGGASAGSAPTERVSVLLKSSPPGAQVETPHTALGSTPVSARFKPGRNYTLVFSREGYRSVTKQLRVTNDPDQELTATLRRAPPAPRALPPTSAPTAAAAPPTASPPAATKPPAPKPAGSSWFKRMFAR